MNTSQSIIVAIDGPSGSGKSTVARLIAREHEYLYIDTGAMFRAIGYALRNLGIDYQKNDLTSEELQKLRESLATLDFVYGQDDEHLVVINGENLTAKIRDHYVSQLASDISKFSPVREFLKDQQRQIARSKSVVMEGRDIGTVIFPKAQVKIFLTASTHQRAVRRLKELQEKFPKQDFSLETIERDIEQRDYNDSHRAIAPLKKAEDAIEVDTSHMNIQEVVAAISSIIKDQKL